MVATAPHPLEVSPLALRRIVDPAALGFLTTETLPAPGAVVGQERAFESIAFALAIKEPSYNLYVAGPTGAGRLTAVMRAVTEAAHAQPPAQDWCYVYDFDHPGEPAAIALPAGVAPAFAQAVDGFVASCRHELRRAFLSDAYRQQRATSLKSLKDERESIIDELQRESIDRGFLLQFTPMGVATIPLKPAPAPSGQTSATPQPSTTELSDGSRADDIEPAVVPMTPVEFEALPAAVRQRINSANEALQDVIAQGLSALNELGKAASLRLHEMNDALARDVVGPLADAMIAAYADTNRITEYIHRLASDLIAHATVLMMTAQEAAIEEAPGNHTSTEDGSKEPDGEAARDTLADEGSEGEEPPTVAALLRRYRVNVMVTQRAEDGAPIVHEINPTEARLVGHIEFGLRNGLPATDHLMLKAGAFHRANGGYLIVHARDLFSQPNSWHAIKRALRFGVVSLEDGEDAISLSASASLRPEPIPVQMKVILIGDPQTYALLQDLDSEFSELFKVRADFDSSMPYSLAGEQFYAQFMGHAARRAGLPPLSADAVALCIEEGTRAVADQGRLSTILNDLRDLAVESASFAAARAARPHATVLAGGAESALEPVVTTRADVRYALAARERRMNLAADRINEMIHQGVILIDTQGDVVGQVNGLTVLLSGSFMFGMPARITARTAPGLAGIVNIERETMMSGPAHSKGILVLGGYLAGRFAHDQPLSLSATICLEQVYGEIEGDSASSAELYALLSSLSGLPLKQSLAVTGSVNQLGVVQAIGGVNEKIEGYFMLASHEGLNGEHGVIIPRANVRHLMLRQEVIDAVRAGAFHIYAVNTIDEGIELLTGVPAGTPDATGSYPVDSVNGRVSQTLRDFARSMRHFGSASTSAYQRVDGIFARQHALRKVMCREGSLEKVACDQALRLCLGIDQGGRCEVCHGDERKGTV